jgi:DNA-binding transcriptional ArsR family regulator
MMSEKILFETKAGEIPFWDNPNLIGHKLLPERYYPVTTLPEAMNLITRRALKKEDIRILRIIGDAFCANEDQVRRYMGLVDGMSRSEVSKRLDRFRERGLVDRWKFRIMGDEEELQKKPAPFTIGVSGHLLLKHFYSDKPFTKPQYWDEKGVLTMQRYIAMNELRCRMAESRNIKNWVWHGIVSHNTSIEKPFGAAEVKTPNGMINFLIERPQQSQDYIGYLRTRLNKWKDVFETRGTIPIYKLSSNVPIVLIYSSTYSIAEHIHRELLVDQYPFTVWFCVEEEMEKGFTTSFFTPNEADLKRIRLDFFQKAVQ